MKYLNDYLATVARLAVGAAKIGGLGALMMLGFLIGNGAPGKFTTRYQQSVVAFADWPAQIVLARDDHRARVQFARLGEFAPGHHQLGENGIGVRYSREDLFPPFDGFR